MEKPKGLRYMLNAIFAVYKGDEHVCTGTASECAEVMKTTARYVYWLSTAAAKKRQAGRKNPEKATTADIIDWEADPDA